MPSKPRLDHVKMNLTAIPIADVAEGAHANRGTIQFPDQKVGRPADVWRSDEQGFNVSNPFEDL